MTGLAKFRSASCPRPVLGPLRAVAQGPSEGLSLCFLLWKGLESKLVQVRRVLKVAEVGKGCEVPVSLSPSGNLLAQGESRADSC